MNAVAAGRAGAQREAAFKVLAFLATDAAMALWLDRTGELPARPSAALAPAVLANPAYGGLARGLAYAVATDFVDEDAQRAVFIAMLDSVLIKGTEPEAAVREAAAAEQKLIDAYYAKG